MDHFVMDRIKLLREKSGYTRKALASKLGIPYSTFTNYENGTRIPPYSFLIAVANEFDTTADYLLGLTDDPEQHKVKKPVAVELKRHYRESLIKKAIQVGIEEGSDDALRGQGAFEALVAGVQQIIDELSGVIVSFSPGDIPLLAVALRVILDECKSNMDEDDMELVDALSGISASGEEAEHE